MAVGFVPVVGQPGGGVWAQVLRLHDAVVLHESLTPSEQWLFLAFVIKGEDDEAVMEVGDGLLAEVERMWEEGLRRKAFFDALQEVVGAGIAVVGGYVDGKQLWFFGKDNGVVYLSRGDALAPIFRAQGDSWEFLHGTWLDGDRILLGSSELVDEISDDLFADLFTKTSITQMGEELVTLVQAGGDNGGVAGFVMEMREAEMDRERAVDDEAVIQEPLEQSGGSRKRPTIYLRSSMTRKKMTVGMGILILGLLMLSIFLGMRRREQLASREAFETMQAEVTQLLTSAQTIAESNPEQAKLLVQEASDQLTESEAEFGNDALYGPEWARLQAQAGEVYRIVSGEVSVTELPVWFELDLIKEGMEGSRLSYDSGWIVVLDPQQGLVGGLTREKKDAGLVGGGEALLGSRDLSIRRRRVMTLANQGVVEVDIDRKTNAVAVEGDATWGNATQVEYFGGNVYVLDLGLGEVWRYPAITDGLGERQRWFAAGVMPDLSGVTDMAIDGDIWMGTRTGEVLRYRRGSEENFAIVGLDAPLGSVTALDVQAEGERVFVLDSSNGRIVIATKEGEYEQQLQWAGLKEVVDLVANEEEREVFVLTGSSIYRLTY